MQLLFNRRDRNENKLVISAIDFSDEIQGNRGIKKTTEQHMNNKINIDLVEMRLFRCACMGIRQGCFERVACTSGLGASGDCLLR